jgi:hypothetical protein
MKCDECDGKGKVLKQTMPYGHSPYVVDEMVKCSACKGAGSVPDLKPVQTDEEDEHDEELLTDGEEPTLQKPALDHMNKGGRRRRAGGN